MLHLNIHSFAKNSDRLFNYLSNISAKFHFIALTETWTNSFNEELVNYVGYNSVVKSRPNETRGGSVALLTKNFYHYAPLTVIDNSLFNPLDAGSETRGVIALLIKDSYQVSK